MVAWLCAVYAALAEQVPTDLEKAREEVWDRVAFMTRYGGATLTEALVELDRADANDYIAAVGRLIRQENAKRD